MERTFRHGERILKLRVRRSGSQVELETEDGTAVFEWEEIAPGDYLLRRDGKQSRCVVARDGDDRWVWIAGRVHHLQVEVGRRGREAGGGELLAPMPGQLLKVFVAPGDTVTKGQPLVILEAMKMQYEMVAPRDGVIAQVAAHEGEQVAGGIALVTLVEVETS